MYALLAAFIRGAATAGSKLAVTMSKFLAYAGPGMDLAVLADEITTSVIGENSPAFKSRVEELLRVGSEADALLDTMVTTQHTIDNVIKGIDNLSEMAKYTSEKHEVIAEKFQELDKLRQLAFAESPSNFVYFDTVRSLDGQTNVADLEAAIAALGAIYRPNPLSLGLQLGIVVGLRGGSVAYRSWQRGSGKAQREPTPALGENDNLLTTAVDPDRLSAASVADADARRASLSVDLAAVESPVRQGQQTANRYPVQDAVTNALSLGAGIYHFVSKYSGRADAVVALEDMIVEHKRRVEYYGYIVDGVPADKMAEVIEYFSLPEGASDSEGLRKGSKKNLEDFDDLLGRFLVGMTNSYVDMQQDFNEVSPQLEEDMQRVTELLEARIKHEGYASMALDSQRLGEHRMEAGIKPAQEQFTSKVIQPLDALITELVQEIDNHKAYARIMTAAVAHVAEERNIEPALLDYREAQRRLMLEVFGIIATEAQLDQMVALERARRIAALAATIPTKRDELIGELNTFFTERTRFTDDADGRAMVLQLLNMSIESYRGPVDEVIQRMVDGIAADLSQKRQTLESELLAYLDELPDATEQTIADVRSDNDALVEADLQRWLDQFDNSYHIHFQDRTVYLDRPSMEAAIRAANADVAQAA